MTAAILLAALAPAAPTPKGPPPDPYGAAGLGVALDPDAFGSPTQRVACVLPGSPASRAGVRSGDTILFFWTGDIDAALKNTDIRFSADNFSRHNFRPGSTVSLSVERGGRLVTFRIEIWDRPDKAAR